MELLTPVYTNEYQSILREIEQQSERSVNSIMNKVTMYIRSISTVGKRQGNSWMKFFTGAIWLLLITVCIPFMDTFNKRSDKILAFILMLTVAIIVGYFFTAIPIIFTPIVNYVGVPILQVILLGIVAGKSNKKK